MRIKVRKCGHCWSGVHHICRHLLIDGDKCQCNCSNWSDFQWRRYWSIHPQWPTKRQTIVENNVAIPVDIYNRLHD